MGRGPKPTAPETRFWPKVVIADDGCWLWTGGRNENGYGTFHPVATQAGSTTTSAHRFAYELLVGPIPGGLELDHLCRNRLCVNPAHLEPVTHAENLRRGIGGPGAQPHTHCHRGHPLSGANLYVSPKGFRRCRACHNDRMRAYLPTYRAIHGR